MGFQILKTSYPHMYMRISSFRRHPALKRKKYCSKRNHEHDGRMQINVRLQADCSRMSKAVPLGIFIYRNDQSDHNHIDRVKEDISEEVT